jgi:predicted AlkP superfamily phosphohydrolase/phosphomutase
MFPPPKISGYIVPGWIPWRQLRLACWPTTLFDRLKSLPGFDARELAMDIKLEEKATEGCSENEYERWVEFHIRREENWFEIVRHLTVEDPSELTAVLFDGVDKLQHLCWRFIDPAYASTVKEDWEIRVKDLCLEYFRHLDALLEKLCEFVGPDSTVLIASDHGFGPTEQVFRLNTWLEQHGYLAWSKTAVEKEAEDGALLGVGRVARHTYLLDWERTTAFSATPTSNGIYIVVNQDGNSPGISPADYLAFRGKLKNELCEVRDPASGQPIVESVWAREEAFAGPCMPSAPDLTLCMRDGGLISILQGESVLAPRPTVAGSHRPVGVFAARGPGMREGVALPDLSILDIAPTVMYSLGLEVSEEFEGRVPPELFTERVLQDCPVRIADAVSAGVLDEGADEQVVLQAEDEATIMKRLRDLGYVE